MSTIIKFSFIAAILVTVVGCGSVKRLRHDHTKRNAVKPVAKPVYAPRSSKYITCVRDLNKDGLKQNLIKTLCDSALGSLD